MQDRNYYTNSTTVVINDFHISKHSLAIHNKDKTKTTEVEFSRKVQLLGEKYNEYGLQKFTQRDFFTVDQLEREFKTLVKLSADKRINEEEKLAIEDYKLILMQATQERLLRNVPSSTVEAEKRSKKPTLFRYFVFGAFLLLEFVPMIWGSYLGITGLMSTIPWLSKAMIAATGLLVCGIEAILYYAVKGPLLKRALGISTPPHKEPCLDTYEKQLQVLKNIDKHLLVTNKMNSGQYQQYVRLAALFSEQINELKTYAIYVKTRFDDPGLSLIEGKALIVVGTKVRFINNKGFIRNEDGSCLTTELTIKEKNKLVDCKRLAQSDKIERTAENIKFLDQVIAKTTAVSRLVEKIKIKTYVESPFKKGLRFVLSAVDMSLNIGGGYFLATSLLAGTTAAAALLGTPVGWGIVALIIVGQFALRLAVGSNAMFNLLNPGAEKHKKVTEEINEYELNTAKYEEILTTKKQIENTRSEHAAAHRELDMRRRGEKAKTNPYVDSYKDNYLNLGLYKTRGRSAENDLEPCAAKHPVPRY